MRTNIELDDDLVAEAMTASGLRTKKATIEKALRAFVNGHRRRAAIDSLSGIGWDGDLAAMRQGRGGRGEK
jgi:Arc/MetJ family transcription regulator